MNSADSMKIVFACIVCCFCMSSMATPSMMSVAKDGKANAVIVIDEAASDDVRFAAHDLRNPVGTDHIKARDNVLFSAN